MDEHERHVPTTPTAPTVHTPSTVSKARMPAALRALGDRLRGPLESTSFGGLSGGARERLAVACAAFADLIEAGEDAPDGGVNLRPWARFLLSALFSLDLTAPALLLPEDDETWLVAEVEADVDAARALLRSRGGQSPALAPTVPPLPVSQLIRP